MELLKRMTDRWNRKHFEKLQEGDMDVINAQKLEQLGCVQKAIGRYEDAIFSFKKAKGFATLLRNKEYMDDAQKRIDAVEETISLFQNIKF